MAKNVVQVQIDAKDGSKAGFNSLKKNLDDSTKKGQEASGTFGNIFKGALGKAVVAIGGTVAALGALKIGLIDSVKAAAQHEDALKLVETALKIAGKSWSSERHKVIAFTDSMQEQTKFSNTEMVETLGQVTILTGDLGKSMAATKLAADIASGGLMDLKSAGMLLARVTLGATEMLTRYGIMLDEEEMKLAGVTTKAEKGAFAMKKLNEMFGGTAQEAVNTYSGASNQLKNSFADLQRVIGQALLPALTDMSKQLTPIIADLAEMVDKLNQARSPISALYREYQSLIDKGIMPANITFSEFIRLMSDLDSVVTNAISKINEKREAIRLEVEMHKARNDVLNQGIQSYIQLTNTIEEETPYLEGWMDYAAGVKSAEEQTKQFTKNLEEQPPVWDDTIAAASIDWDVHWQNMYNQASERMAGVTAAINTGMQSILNVNMTGTERLRAIFMSFASTVLSQIANIISKKLIWAAVDRASATAQITALGIEQAQVAALTASYLALAAAKRAAMGPLGFIFNQGGLVPGHQSGGMVFGPSGIDRVPAMLTSGEFVVNASATSEHLALLEAINAQRFQHGGTVNSNNSSSISVNVGDNVNMTTGELVSMLIPELESAISQRRFLV